MGRPSKLTPERAERIVSLIRAGNYASQAARASGIGERTYYRWLEQGEALDDKCEAWEEAVERWNEMTDAQRRAHPEMRPREEDAPTPDEIAKWQFWREVKKAEAEAEAGALLRIQQAASQGTWQAAAWYLERKHPDRWGKRAQIDHAGTIEHRHEHQIGIPSGDDVIEAARRLQEIRQAKERALIEGSAVEIVGDEDESDAEGAAE